MMRVFLIALLVASACAADPLGIVTSVSGPVKLGGKPLELLAPLPPGAEVVLPAKAALEVTFYSGKRWTIQGPGRVKLTAAGPQGPGVEPVAARQAAGGMVVKPVSGTLGAAYERIGEKMKALTFGGQRSPTPELLWSAYPDARVYHVSVVTLQRAPVLEQDVPAPATSLSWPSAPLAPGDYRLKVVVQDPEFGQSGVDASAESEFRVLTPEQTRELQSLEASPPEFGLSLLLLARYLQLRLDVDAVKLGETLLKQHDDPGLRRLVSEARKRAH